MEEKSSFVKLFGEHPTVKVIDFLITFREFDYSLKDISENAGIAWSTLHSILPDLLELEVIRETRKVGRAKMYKLNGESSIVKQLVTLDNKLIKELADELTLEKVAVPIS